MAIKSADEHVKTIDRLAATRAKEAREFREKQAELEYYNDLRDNVVSIMKNSGMTLTEIHARGGATVRTLSRWIDDKTVQPRLGKLRAVLVICDYDFQIVPRRHGLRVVA